jgi:hypothetical protein
MANGAPSPRTSRGSDRGSSAPRASGSPVVRQRRAQRRAYKLVPTGNQGVRLRATPPTTPVNSPPPDSLRVAFPPDAGGRLHDGPLRETSDLGAGAKPSGGALRRLRRAARCSAISRCVR